MLTDLAELQNCQLIKDVWRYLIKPMGSAGAFVFAFLSVSLILHAFDSFNVYALTVVTGIFFGHLRWHSAYQQERIELLTREITKLQIEQISIALPELRDSSTVNVEIVDDPEG